MNLSSEAIRDVVAQLHPYDVGGDLHSRGRILVRNHQDNCQVLRNRHHLSGHVYVVEPPIHSVSEEHKDRGGPGGGSLTLGAGVTCKVAVEAHLFCL
jgi:hypothetical protein